MKLVELFHKTTFDIAFGRPIYPIKGREPFIVNPEELDYEADYELVDGKWTKQLKKK